MTIASMWARCLAALAASLVGCAGAPVADAIDLGSPADLTPISATDGSAADLARSGNGLCAGSVPLVYHAMSDRMVRQPPSPPALGPAGTIFKDPDFGSRILRVTDASTLAAAPNRSFLVENNFWTNTWNTDATIFCIGVPLCYAFDPKTMTATLIANLKDPVTQGGFSLTDPNLYYGKGPNNSLSQFDFSNHQVTELLAMDAVVKGVGGYIVNVTVSANEIIAANFGGIQGTSPYVVAYDNKAGTHHLLDTLTSLVDGNPSNMPLGCYTNNSIVDRSGRYVSITLAAGPGGKACSAPIIWDLQTGMITPMLVNHGIGEMGYGNSLVRGGGGNSEAFQWQTRSLATPDNLMSVLATPLQPPENMIGVFTSWNNALPSVATPFLAASLRYPADPAPWRAWDNEIIAVSVDGMEVWRFAHTFSTYSGTIYSDDYYYLFRSYISQNGWFAVFSSNWGDTLGTDPMGKARRDVFVVELANPCGP